MCPSLHNTHYARAGGFPSANCWLNGAGERFWARVAKVGPEACWLWTGYTASHGYGHAYCGHAGHRRARAHRLAWFLTYGEIPAGLEVCHSCDTPACCNPVHLFLGTHRQNIHDSIRKGRKGCWGLQKLNAEQVRAIRRRYAGGDVTQRSLGREFGIARNTVSQIIRRKVWSHVV